MQVDFATINNGKGKLPHKCIQSFRRCPREILYDNTKAVVIRRDCCGAGRHRFQDMFLDKCRHSGTVPPLCHPYRAKPQGKVERFINYIKHNFYYPEYIKLKMDGLVMDMETANIKLADWNADIADKRIHATSGRRPIDMFEEKKEHLMPLPAPYTDIYPVKACEQAEATSSAFIIPDINVQTSSLDMYDALIHTGVV